LSGLEQFARDAVPEAVNPDMDSVRDLCATRNTAHRASRSRSR